MTYAYFVTKFAPLLSDYGTTEFWNSIVLQACSNNVAIKHLVLATTNLYGFPNHGTPDIPTDVPFLVHYCKAMKLLSEGPQNEAVVVLVACVLFAVCEDLQLRPQNAQIHIQAAHRILASHSTHNTALLNSPTLSEIATTISRLIAPRPPGPTSAIARICDENSQLIGP